MEEEEFRPNRADIIRWIKIYCPVDEMEGKAIQWLRSYVENANIAASVREHCTKGVHVDKNGSFFFLFLSYKWKRGENFCIALNS